jgi:hypothetical protein
MKLNGKSSPSLDSFQARRDEKPACRCLMFNYQELGR